jgi:pimeloyl-ACP methyl ester carboxylesterase
MVPSGEAFFGRLGPAIAAYSAGDRRTAMETFTNAVGGDADYRALMDPVLGQGWFDQAVADADTLFAVEFPAVQGWAFGPDQAARIDQPVLAVVGGESLTLFNEGFDLLKDWFPGAEGYVLPGANHFLQVVNPGDMATALAAFLGRHPIAA